MCLATDDPRVEAILENTNRENVHFRILIRESHSVTERISRITADSPNTASSAEHVLFAFKWHGILLDALFARYYVAREFAHTVASELHLFAARKKNQKGFNGKTLLVEHEQLLGKIAVGLGKIGSWPPKGRPVGRMENPETPEDASRAAKDEARRLANAQQPGGDGPRMAQLLAEVEEVNRRVEDLEMQRNKELDVLKQLVDAVKQEQVTGRRSAENASGSGSDLEQSKASQHWEEYDPNKDAEVVREESSKICHDAPKEEAPLIDLL